jgi:hypothetical protein
MDREEYLSNYRQTHRQYYRDKSKERHAAAKREHGPQHRSPTRKFFVGIPIKTVTVVPGKYYVTFD